MKREFQRGQKARVLARDEYHGKIGEITEVMVDGSGTWITLEIECDEVVFEAKELGHVQEIKPRRTQ